MPQAEHAYTSGRDSQTPRRPLSWKQALTHVGQAEAELRNLLFERGIPRKYRDVIQQVLHDHIEPVIASDSRYSRPAPGVAPSDRDRRFMPPHLRRLTDAQLADYRLLKANGYSKTEAPEMVQKPKAKVAPVPPDPRDFRHLEGLTRQQIADRRPLVQSGQHVVAEVIAVADRQANGEAGR